MAGREERLDTILRLLSERGSIEIAEVCEELGVSQATARRDLDSLQERMLLTRTRGGATTVSAVDYQLSRRYVAGSRTAQIEAVAKRAASLVQPGDRVGLSGGRTTTELARQLAADERFAEHGLTIVTNAINIAQLLVVRPYIRVVVTGGIVLQGSYELSGPFAELILREITLDRAFIGVNGLDLAIGATVTQDVEAPINRLMARRAGECWIVCDSSKIGKREFAVVGAVTDFSGIVTDDEISTEALDGLAELGVPVMLA